jgi:hypothetical protein
MQVVVQLQAHGTAHHVAVRQRPQRSLRVDAGSAAICGEHGSRPMRCTHNVPIGTLCTPAPRFTHGINPARALEMRILAALACDED